MNSEAQSYASTLDFLFSQLPMYTRVGAAAYKPNLDNTLLLAAKNGDPQHKFKSIHIAGTNGKGSCSSLLATALRKSGYRTALYTSPHIVDFRERIRIDGEMISQQFVIDFVAKNRKHIDDIKPSFFELTVVMAFCYFAEQSIDIAVIEVGLGGLLDSTNIILPEVSVITNISNDHAYLLGNTLEEIATQKAGIIKKGIPVVIGETQVETEKIFFTKSLFCQAPIFYADQRYQAVQVKDVGRKQMVKIIDKSALQSLHIYTDLMGHYQAKNIITVMMTLEVMKNLGWKFERLHYENVFSDVAGQSGLRGRFELIQLKPRVIFDVSHNEAGISALFAQINKRQSGRLYIVTGFVKDKEIREILKLFPRDAQYYFVQADMPRALSANELAELATKAGLEGSVFPSIEIAIQSAMDQLQQDDTLLVTGSFFILADAYRYFENKRH